MKKWINISVININNEEWNKEAHVLEKRDVEDFKDIWY